MPAQRDSWRAANHTRCWASATACSESCASIRVPTRGGTAGTGQCSVRIVALAVNNLLSAVIRTLDWRPGPPLTSGTPCMCFM